MPKQGLDDVDDTNGRDRGDDDDDPDADVTDANGVTNEDDDGSDREIPVLPLKLVVGSTNRTKTTNGGNNNIFRRVRY